MSLTILAPLEGDTVTSPVTVSSTFTVAADCTVTSTAAGIGDGGVNVLAADTSSNSNPIAVGATGMYPVSASASDVAGNSDTQNNVNINAQGTPPPTTITGVATEEFGVGYPKTVRIKGTVPYGSAAAYVLVLVLEVDPTVYPATRTPVAAGAGLVTALNWSVKVTYTEKVKPIQYVARSYVLDATLNVLGSTTKPIPHS